METPPLDITKLVSTTWRIRDNGREFESKWEKAIEQILEGEIGYFSSIYDESSGKWVPTSEKPEFSVALPFSPLFKLGDKLKYFLKVYEKSLVGVVSVGPDWKDLISVAKAFRSEGLPKGIAFFVPILCKDLDKRITRPVSMLQPFDGFLVSAFFEDKKVTASTGTPLLVMAMNLSDSYSSHTLIPYEFPIPENEKSKLDFDLPPSKWVLRCLRIDTTACKSGSHKVEFRTASRTERAAKAAVAAALTLGMLRYDSGYKGFSISFEVVPPDQQKTTVEHLEKGELLYRLCDYWASRTELENVIKQDPDNPKTHRLLGTVYSMLDENESAERELKKTIELNPNDDEAHNNLGALYDKLKRDEEAEREFRESIRIKPNDLINHYNLAVFFGKRDKLYEAKNEYLEMLKLDSKCIPAYSGLFSLLMKRKESKKEQLKQLYLEAEKLFAEGIVRLSDNANMHSYLGYVQLHLRKFKEAEREFNVALRLDQRNQLAQVFLALKQKGEWEKIGLGD